MKLYRYKSLGSVVLVKSTYASAPPRILTGGRGGRIDRLKNIEVDIVTALLA